MEHDFIGFSFDGIHSSKLNILRVSEGDRYEEERRGYSCPRADQDTRKHTATEVVGAEQELRRWGLSNQLGVRGVWVVRSQHTGEHRDQHEYAREYGGNYYAFS